MYFDDKGTEFTVLLRKGKNKTWEEFALALKYPTK